MLQRRIQVGSINLIKVEENKMASNHSLVRELKKKSRQKIISLGETAKILIIQLIYNLAITATMMTVLMKKMIVALDDMVIPRLVRSIAAAMGSDKMKVVGIAIVEIVMVGITTTTSFEGS